MISVLYVDDWSPLLHIISRFLMEKGDIIVETSLSPEEACRKMDFFSFDVIITDYNSKDSAGIGLLQQTRQKGKMTPFVFFTLRAKPCNGTRSRTVWPCGICAKNTELRFEL